MFVIVCYDISSNKLRNQISKHLWKYGIRVQKSVFECEVENNKEYETLVKELEKLLKKFKPNKEVENLKDMESTNTIRLYVVWEKQKAKIKTLWVDNGIYEVPPYIIV